MAASKMLTIAVPGAQHTLELRCTRAPQIQELAVVAPPHPLYGGSIGNPVVRALESALQGHGLGTLAFNFRGTGASTGQPSGDLSDALTDYVAAARSAGDAQLAWLSGYSFGSCAALAAAIELKVERVLMVGPPLALLEPQLLPRFSGELHVVVGSEDDYAPLAALRETFAAAHTVRIEVVEGADHFFLGSQCRQLGETLSKLLADVR
jgi:alpha/beta superfamily hydrolase